MTVLAALAGFAFALVLVLGWMVLTLRRDISELSSRLSTLTASVPAQEQTAPVVVESARPQANHEPDGDESSPAEAVRTVVSLDSRDDHGDQDAPDPRVTEEVPVITALADQVDDADLTTRRVASVTLARPLIKVAALTYGVRKALDDEHRMRVRLTMRRELKRQRKMRRRRRAGRAPSQGWVP